MGFQFLPDYLAQPGRTREQALDLHRTGEITLHGWRCVWGHWGNRKTEERPENIRDVPVLESFGLHWEPESSSGKKSVLLWGDAPFEPPPDFRDLEERALDRILPLTSPKYRRGWVVVGVEINTGAAAKKAARSGATPGRGKSHSGKRGGGGAQKKKKLGYGEAGPAVVTAIETHKAELLPMSTRQDRAKFLAPKVPCSVSTAEKTLKREGW